MDLSSLNFQQIKMLLLVQLILNGINLCKTAPIKNCSWSLKSVNVIIFSSKVEIFSIFFSVSLFFLPFSNHELAIYVSCFCSLWYSFFLINNENFWFVRILLLNFGFSLFNVWKSDRVFRSHLWYTETHSLVARIFFKFRNPRFFNKPDFFDVNNQLSKAPDNYYRKSNLNAFCSHCSRI